MPKQLFLLVLKPSFRGPVQLQLPCQDSSINWLVTTWPPLPARSPGWLGSSCQRRRCQGCRGGWGAVLAPLLGSRAAVGQPCVPVWCWPSGRAVSTVCLMDAVAFQSDCSRLEAHQWLRLLRSCLFCIEMSDCEAEKC